MRYLTIDQPQTNNPLQILAIFTTLGTQQQIKRLFNLTDTQLQATHAPVLAITKSTRYRYGEFLDLSIHQLRQSGQPLTAIQQQHLVMPTDQPTNWLDIHTLQFITHQLFKFTDITAQLPKPITFAPISNLSTDDFLNLIGFIYRTNLFYQPLNLTARYTVNFNSERR